MRALWSPPPMSPEFTLVHDQMGPSLLRYAEVMGRTLKGTVERAAKGVTRRVIEITPPGSQGTIGAAAYRQGRQKIARQMAMVLAPVKLKGRRKVTKVFGRPLKRVAFVKTTERYPAVAEEYRKRTRARGSGVGISAMRGPKAFVDIVKFRAVLAAKQARVGALASGWAAAADALDVPVQQWIARHGAGRGTIKRELGGAQMRITVQNLTGGLPANLAAELDRRINYAVRYQRDAMKREVDYYAGKVARDLAIKTRNFSALVPAGMMGGEAA